MTETTPIFLDGVRTPFDRLRGALRGVDTRELLATAIGALVERHPALSTPDGVLLGQVLQAVTVRIPPGWRPPPPRSPGRCRRRR